MKTFLNLKDEIQNTTIPGAVMICPVLYSECVRQNYSDPEMIAKAKGLAYSFEHHKKYVYENDLILGSYKGLFVKSVPEKIMHRTNDIMYAFKQLSGQGSHYAPDYEYVLSRGIGGIVEDIEKYKEKYKDDEEKVLFLESAKISIRGLGAMLRTYGEKALSMGKKTEAEICFKLETQAPETFREALQLMWMCHLSFYCENRPAMALGRADQFLYPFYKKDIDNGTITRDDAVELFTSMIYKMYELQKIFEERDGRFDTVDVVNICIGGVDKDGNSAENDLTFVVIEAVKTAGICGPNLSARVSEKSSDKFLDACLECIGTGVGYPSLMNDEVNIAALLKLGYDLEDCRDYAMVGCIENFMAGKQPPWTDMGVNSAKELEYALNNGRCAQTGLQMGPKTGEAEELDTMEKLIEAYRQQVFAEVEEMCILHNMRSTKSNPLRDKQPYLSCYSRTCLERALDINQGGTKYPTAFGIGATGHATVADSFAAIEKVVFEDKIITLAELRDILAKNFEGHEDIRARLLAAPKYGNNDEYADKYARLHMDIHYDARKDLRAFDGGYVYMSIASNVHNIRCGKELGATPDGRKAGEALSDAASPMRGMDKRGLTQAMLSVSKPDYSKSALGTVYNIKLTENMFTNTEKRDALREMIKVYFAHGGQEVQINCVSRKTLEKAYNNPEDYTDLVVRVSGFSAFYTTLSKEIQKDILERTEHE